MRETEGDASEGLHTETEQAQAGECLPGRRARLVQLLDHGIGRQVVAIDVAVPQRAQVVRMRRLMRLVEQLRLRLHRRLHQKV